jgi:hypothetical protein
MKVLLHIFVCSKITENVILWLFRLSHSFIFFWFYFYHCVCGCIFCMLQFNFENYVFLLLCFCILIFIYVPFWVFCFVVFCVLFACECVLYYCHRVSNPIAVNRYIIYYIISPSANTAISVTRNSSRNLWISSRDVFHELDPCG